MSRWFSVPRIVRDPGVSSRAAGLAYFGRFTDELLFGAIDVLKPTLVARFGLTYAQVGLLHLVLDWVAGAVEPLSALLIDVWERRWLLAWGAAGLGVATMLVGFAPSFAMLLVAFGIYGVASGPLAHTADVVLVESHPSAPSRAFALATALDTTGALLAPLAVTVWALAGFDWRWLLAVLGCGGLGYAVLLARTPFPRPPAREVESQARMPVHLEFVANLRAVASDLAARRWLLFLFVHSIVEAPDILQVVWLAEEGMSQSLIGAYVAFEMVAALLGVLFLNRQLERTAQRQIMLVAAAALLVLVPAWYLVPGTWVRFVIGAPLGFVFATFWPIARSESLTTASARPGAVTAVSAIMALVPIPLGVALLSEAIGLMPALLSTQWVGALALFVVIWRGLPLTKAEAESDESS